MEANQADLIGRQAAVFILQGNARFPRIIRPLGGASVAAESDD
jgi:hypothetical protein